MGSKFVNLFLPLEEENSVLFSVSKIPPKEKTVYDAVGFFEDEIFLKSKFKFKKMPVKEKIFLRDIVNLHDEEGLDIDKIKNMSKHIELKNHIFSDSGMPNIKLIKLKSGELVAFDGHHTLNSYLFCNKEYLFQVPYIVVGSKAGLFEDDVIRSFFGKHSRKIKDKNSRDYIINWNAPNNLQVSFRKRKNIGEVFDVLKRRLTRIF